MGEGLKGVQEVRTRHADIGATKLMFYIGSIQGLYRGHVGLFCLIATVEGLGLNGFWCKCGISDAGVYLLAVGPSLAELDSILRLVERAFFTPKHCCFLVQELFKDQGPPGNHSRKPQALNPEPQLLAASPKGGLGLRVWV